MLKGIRGSFLVERIGKGKNVLDIGCRDGALTSTYCQGNNVLGLDIDQEALDYAATQFDIETKQVDLNGDWGVVENFYDAVVAGEVVEHLYSPDDVVRKIANVLKDEGVFLGSVPNAFSLKNRLRYVLGTKEHTPLADPTHINHFSRKELEDLLGKYFKIVNIFPIGKYAFLERFFPGLFSFVLIFEAREKKSFRV